jgi:hypothetical protein
MSKNSIKINKKNNILLKLSSLKYSFIDIWRNKMIIIKKIKRIKFKLDAVIKREM